MADDIRWLTVRDAAARARCGVKTIYRAVRAGQLRAARVGGRRELRLLVEWIDGWLISLEPTVIDIDVQQRPKEREQQGTMPWR